jgi:hypothetical protein
MQKRNWVHVPSSHWKRDGKSEVNYTEPVPTIVNCYVKELTNITLDQRLEVKQKTEERKMKTMVRRKHKVLIIGASHVIGCAVEVSPNLDKDFEGSGLVMSGSRRESITNMAKKEIAPLTRDDVVVVWGGTNNISKNESSKGLTHISSFVQNRGHTNIVIMSVPHRHDLGTASCINNEVKVFNRKLFKTMKMYDYVKVVETNFSRGHFTQHGLHTNRLRKECISKIISENIKSVRTRQRLPPISMKWKEDSTDLSPVENTIDGKSDNELELKGTEARMSGRHR